VFREGVNKKLVNNCLSTNWTLRCQENEMARQCPVQINAESGRWFFIFFLGGGVNGKGKIKRKMVRSISSKVFREMSPAADCVAGLLT
jgi:hypothetical protein